MAASVLIRIGLRYLAAILVAKGVLSPGFGDLVTFDPDVSMYVESFLGLLVGVGVEGWYAIAKRFGWST